MVASRSPSEAARLGYVAPIGSTDEDRIRHLTVVLPPRHAARLFEAQEAGASDDRLREIAAEALKETYFQAASIPAVGAMRPLCDMAAAGLDDDEDGAD